MPPVPLPPLRFTKYHGLGNDFVVVDGPRMDAARAVRLCDRHRGIGADGVLTILPPRTPGAVATMHVFNADGSVSRMCGNGIRCVARHLADQYRITGPLTIDSDAGPRACTVHRDAAGQVEAISVEMGPARVDDDQRFTVDDESLLAVRVDLGNPHAVLFDEPSRERAGLIGPAIERQVPGGVNVGFARPGPDGIDLVVWERGCGLTDACGTGACAAAVAATRAGASPAGTPVEVRLPGGSLLVTVSADLASVIMRGPAERVFQGEIGI
jgi:diaminopimelate epimerase